MGRKDASNREGSSSDPPSHFEGLNSSTLSYVLNVRYSSKNLLIISHDRARAEEIAANCRGWFGDGAVALLVHDEHTHYEGVAPDGDLVGARYRLRRQFLEGVGPQVVVATGQLLLQKWMSTEGFVRSTKILKRGTNHKVQELAAHLVACGYLRLSQVDDSGAFAVCGSVVDVFIPGDDYPVRIDFFGDEIERIFSFHPDTFRPIQHLEKLEVFPIRDVIFDAQSQACAGDALKIWRETSAIPSRILRQIEEDIRAGHYFFGVESLWPLFYEESESLLETIASNYSVVLDQASATEDVIHSFFENVREHADTAESSLHPALPVEKFYITPEDFWSGIQGRLLAKNHLLLLGEMPPMEERLLDFKDLAHEMELRRKDPNRGDILGPVVDWIRNHSTQSKESILLACERESQGKRIQALLRGHGIDLPILSKHPNLLPSNKHVIRPVRGIWLAPLSQGFFDEIRGVAIFTEKEILGALSEGRSRKTRTSRKSNYKETLKNIRNLSSGDGVIHVEYGIGRYLGMERMRVGGIEEDFVRLEYAGGDKLMVPMYHLSQLQEYRGSSEHVRLDKLGGMRWEKTKRKVKDAVLQIAHELLQVQAYRQSQKGFSMAGPDHHFKTFEAAFPFEETLDQLKAIEACILDLSKETPMDRVVCGDVGFGKTEVAIRAAYLAVLNGYQVAILVPTTVLAEQHGKTFSERLEPFGVTVEVLNRFRTKKKANQILERAREAKLDILVGTHRLLSADVHYKNLGLLIVDEEHRFGVKHKERVKQIRQKINVLTLTATPIPRTLYMATSGVRDLSVIQTPPVDRLDVQTYVLRFEEQLIKDAIDKELSRGGQVFFLHNRVESIESMVGLLQELVPDARIGVGHGQMSGSALENVMVQFVRHDLDILVCTTIIESGIDIPRANTIFVHRADHFGLSQLHQIRGRIGRSSIRGFAYFLLPRDEQVNPDAMDRLMVLKRYSELGSGYNISLQDLELRGAGDLLGKNQSGHIAAVGFELYMELLKQAVEQAQGRESTLAIEPELKIPFPAFLPESYIEQPSHRFEWYQRFSSEVSPEGIECLRNDLKQLHGPLPSEAENVVSTMKLRLHLKRLGCSALSVAFDDSEFRLGLSFVPESPIDRIKLSTLLHERAPRWTLTSTGKLAIREPWVRKTQIKPLELIIDLVSALPTHRGFRS